MSKAEKKWLIKNWSPLCRQLLGHRFYMDWRRKLPVSNVHCLRVKTIKYGKGPGKVKSTLHN
jgi:hypothetical protein